ncbi:MAG TPA: DUF1801 domain-containing protein [Anaerolineae bacterium]|nr:DUF1801 domain-containing protein [Anaerolineae bacterium]
MSDNLSKLLTHYPPEVQDLILKARELILETVPTACETVYLGWKTIGYSATGSMQGAFCAIDPQRARVNFVFHRGVDLPDPDGLLEGTGKKMRHVKIETAKQLQSRALKRLLKAAAKFQPEESA